MNSFFYPGDPGARTWVKEQTAKSSTAGTATSAPGSAAAPPPTATAPAERVGADESAAYLENKQDYLDYPAFLAAGWPVASGLIEGAARWQVRTAWK